MEGWTEEEIKDKNLMAPCGLYCGVCGVYIATRDKNEKSGPLWATSMEQRQKRPNVMAACSLIPLRSFMATTNPAR